MKNKIVMQRDYYSQSAAQYEAMHVVGSGEHDLACALIGAFCRHYGFKTILDVGSGTGRAIKVIAQHYPELHIIGIEPVEAMRKIGHSNGISESRLIEGDATRLTFADSSFDLVCELGVLHHISNPRTAIKEMLRVSAKAIFISDTNRFGHGAVLGRYAKLISWKLGLWPVVNWIKTRGRGFHYCKGDGVSYSYSVFDDYGYIKKNTVKITIVNLDGFGCRPILSAAHIGLLAIK